MPNLADLGNLTNDSLEVSLLVDTLEINSLLYEGMMHYLYVKFVT